MTMSSSRFPKRLALLCIALVSLASTGSLADDEIKPLATTLDGESEFIELKEKMPGQVDVVYKAPHHLKDDIAENTPIEDIDADEDESVEDIDVKDKPAVPQGTENEGRADGTIAVKDKPPSHLKDGDRPGGVAVDGRTNTNESKPPSHLADGDTPGGVKKAPTEAEDEDTFSYPSRNDVEKQSDESSVSDPISEEDPAALIRDGDGEAGDLVSVEDPAALIREDGEDWRSEPTKDEGKFIESENGAAFIGAEYKGEDGNMVDRSQGRTMNVPMPEKELETTLLYGDIDPNVQGRSGVVQNEFYPAVMIGEENEYEIREEHANDIHTEENEDGRIGTRALSKETPTYIDTLPQGRKHKRMLRNSVAARVNIKRSSRGVEIRDEVVQKARGRPANIEVERGQRELYQVTQACTNKVENDGWVGDGWCDNSGGYNTAACGYDGGDCCKHTCQSLGVEGYDCSSNFDCKDPVKEAPAVFDYTKCYKSVGTDVWVGDGYCDRTGGYNNAECNYDGGDCCESTCKAGSGGDCTGKFDCQNPNAQTGSGAIPPPPTPSPTKNPTSSPTKTPTKAPVPAPTPQGNQNGKPDYNVVSRACKDKVENWQWVGDGWCDPDSKYNSAACGYDGGDCCQKTCTDGAYECGTATGVGYRCEDPWAKNGPAPTPPNRQPTPANNPPTPANNNNSTPNGFNQNLSGEDKTWLDFHNVRRKRYQEQYGYSYVPLMWSNTIAQSSQRYANKLAQGRCEDYDHDPNNPWGENLAVIWGNHNIERVMKAWVENEELAPNAPYKSGHGHMTQALWRATKYIGCAWSQNSECKLYVCRYIKPGNCNRGTNTWLADTMESDSPCGPDCPPNEGCFHPHDTR